MRQNRNASASAVVHQRNQLASSYCMKSDRGNGVASAPVYEEVPGFDALREKAYHSAPPIAAT